MKSILDSKAKVKEIITNVDELHDWSQEIDPVKEGKLAQQIILELKATMRENNLQYLTAPQIGHKRRIFCIRFGKTDIRTFVNPVVSNNSNFQMSREECSSLPDRMFIRPRFGKVEVFFTTPLGKVETTKLFGMAAIVFQHCMDHLDGLLLEDIGFEIDEDFDKLTDDERAELLKMYAESLDIAEKELNKDIEQDEETKQIADAAKFIQSVKSGETILETDSNNK